MDRGNRDEFMLRGVNKLAKSTSLLSQQAR